MLDKTRSAEKLVSINYIILCQLRNNLEYGTSIALMVVLIAKGKMNPPDGGLRS